MTRPMLPFMCVDRATNQLRAVNGRRLLYQCAYGVAEDVAIAADDVEPFGFTGRNRIAINYFGAALWRFGHQAYVVDPNCLLLLRAGQEYADAQLGDRIGRASVLLTMAPDVIEEAADWRPASKHAVNRSGTRSSSLRLRLLTQALLDLGSGEHWQSDLAAEELLIDAYGEAMGAGVLEDIGGASALVARAKDVLHSAENGPALRLAEIAGEVGCSATHLTRLFRRYEGVPLHRYGLRLRLSRSLVRLRGCEDITDLALELGFSSHSHFTTVFRLAFGITPSAYRLARC